MGFKHYFLSYFSEKGKNQATKEDIGNITREIESIKHSYDLLLEEHRKKRETTICSSR